MHTLSKEDIPIYGRLYVERRGDFPASPGQLTHDAEGAPLLDLPPVRGHLLLLPFAHLHWRLT